MKIRGFFLGAGAIALSSIWLSGGALAFCGKVQASASGATRNAAISSANAKGLQETRWLDRNYGGNVHYKPATVNCEESDTDVSTAISPRNSASTALKHNRPLVKKAAQQRMAVREVRGQFRKPT